MFLTVHKECNSQTHNVVLGGLRANRFFIVHMPRISDAFRVAVALQYFMQHVVFACLVVVSRRDTACKSYNFKFIFILRVNYVLRKYNI